MSLYIVTVIYQDFALGGHEWKQGDWLINSVNDTVRRGIMGSAILWFASAASLDPILVTTVSQGLLFGISIVLLSLAIERSSSRATLWLLVLSPAFFVNFWAVDPDGALRKELLIFLAFSVLLYATTMETLSKALVFVSALVFGVAVVSHEGNVFFAPFFFLSYFLIYKSGQIEKPLLITLLALTLLACLATIAVALRFSNVEDHFVVCQPLLDAGVRTGICDGAIKALELNLAFFTEATFWMLFSTKVLSFLLMYGLACISIFVIGFHFFDKKTMFWASFGSAFFFLPLYVVAVDWGRWLSFHASAVIFTMLIILSLNAAKTARRSDLSHWPFIALTIFSIVWGCSHFVDVKWGGVLLKTLSGIAGAA